ncbi:MULTISPECIES: Omp28-related outer membrane protein [unclassified Myroides]|uniref:Omp28-related outer membrane protein n=1 Tax=unclassified Myroides TaxID=2642485 RepID=UPI003D2F8B87
MKKTILKSTLLVLTMAFMTGCSSDDSSIGGNPGGPEGPEGPEETETVYYAHKSILEDFTSIGCPACPIGSFMIEEIEKSDYKDQIIPIALHDDYNYSDPYRLPFAETYARHMELAFYPSLFWNRNKPAWDQPNQFIDGELDANKNPVYFLAKEEFAEYIKGTGYLKEKSNIGIKINSELQATNGTVTVNLKFSEDLNANLKLVVYVLEDGLVSRQANSTPLYGNTSGRGRWESNFVHNHVVRASNNVLGDAIAASATVKDTEFTTSVELTYDTIDLSKSEVVVVILDEKGLALNAQKAKANTTQDYQVVK